MDDVRTYTAGMSMDIDREEREQIEAKMSERMGECIERIGKMDFTDWTPEEWQQLVSIAFDCCVPEIFFKRMTVHGPNHYDDHTPF